MFLSYRNQSIDLHRREGTLVVKGLIKFGSGANSSNILTDRAIQYLQLIVAIRISCQARRASRGGVQRVRTPALFRYSPNCALKFLNQFRRNALKNQFRKRKNPSKRCTNSILLKCGTFYLSFHMLSLPNVLCDMKHVSIFKNNTTVLRVKFILFT